MRAIPPGSLMVARRRLALQSRWCAAPSWLAHYRVPYPRYANSWIAGQLRAALQ